MCNVWVPISITKTFTDVVAQDNTNPYSCSVKLWILKQGYCKTACLHTCMPFGSCGNEYCSGFSAFWVPTVFFGFQSVHLIPEPELWRLFSPLSKQGVTSSLE